MDRIIETQDGYDVIVNHQRFGTWRSKREAAGGLQVEQLRNAARIAKSALLPGNAAGCSGLPNS